MNDVNKKLGTLLKEERERQSIRIEDLSERLKISIPNLQSIETGTTDSLPSELYFTLFAKSYSESLGIDYSRTVEAIKRDIEETINSEKPKPNDKKQKNAEDDDSASENQFLKKSGIALGVIVGLFLIFLGVNKLFFDSNESLMGSSGETAQQISESKSEKELDEAYNNYNWDNAKYDAPTKMELTLTAKQESWSAIFADGDTAIYRTLRAGQTYKVEADYYMLISVGVPSVVTIKLNGKEVDLRDNESRRIYKVLINQMNIDEFLNRDKDESSVDLTNKTSTLSQEQAQSVVVAKDSISIENIEANE